MRAILGVAGQQSSPGGPSPELFRPLPIHKSFWSKGKTQVSIAAEGNPAWTLQVAQQAGPGFNPLTSRKNWGWREQGHGCKRTSHPPPPSSSHSGGVDPLPGAK